MTSIALGMIVRDAEAHVARCVASALPVIDRAVIIDTGCVDNTIPLLKRALGRTPLDLSESEWVGHAHNRSELLAKVRESGANYCLMLDADMELVREGPDPDFTADEYMIPIRDRGLVYPLPLLTSTRRDFYYAGVAHSYLACRDGRDVNGVLLNQWALIDHGGGGHRPGKIERDAELLAMEVGKNPGDRRSWFYLAQSYRDLDRVEEAIAAYKIRASLGGWSEEVYQALYQGGMLMCEHVNYYEGAKMLITAAEMKPNRAEALRALAGCSVSVADKIPFPTSEVLFVEPGAYRDQTPPAPPPAPAPVPLTLEEMPPVPGLKPKVRRRRRGVPLKANEVSAVIVTRGNVPLLPTIDPIRAAGIDDIVVWNNAEREHDYRIFGRYAALAEIKNPVVFWVDDDVVFTNFDALFDAYQPGALIANMDEAWVKGAGYNDALVLMGAGSLCDAHLPSMIFSEYLKHFPFDDDLLVECDFAFGTLAVQSGLAYRVDVGYEVREFSDAPDRLYLQPGQTERKRAMIQRCLEMPVGAR